MQKSNIFMNTTNKINTVRYLTDEDLLKLDASYYAIKRKKYLRSECVKLFFSIKIILCTYNEYVIYYY